MCFKTGRPGQELPVSPRRRHRHRPAPSVRPSLGGAPSRRQHPQPPAGRGLQGRGCARCPRCPRGDGAGRALHSTPGPCPAPHYSTQQAAAPPVPPPAGPAHDWLSPAGGGRSASSRGPRSCPSARGVEGRWQHGRGCGGVRRRR